MSIVINQIDLQISVPNRDIFYERWRKITDNNPDHDPIEIYFSRLIGMAESMKGNAGVIERIKSQDNCAGYTCAKGVLRQKYRITSQLPTHSLTSILFFGTILKDDYGFFRVPVLYFSNCDWFLVFRNLREGFSGDDYLATFNKKD